MVSSTKIASSGKISALLTFMNVKAKILALEKGLASLYEGCLDKPRTEGKSQASD
jgi:hypothetical protein